MFRPHSTVFLADGTRGVGLDKSQVITFIVYGVHALSWALRYARIFLF